MSDQKPTILAASAGALALAANGTAAAIAITTTTQPEAVLFGALGLVAALIGLVTIVVWVCCGVAPHYERPEPAQEPLPQKRVFTPWRESSYGSEALAIEPIEEIEEIADEEETEEDIAPQAVPVAEGAAIIYLADWVKTHHHRRAHA
jgi:hypothetical protein